MIPSRDAWTAGVASWFKANGFCQSIGASLATLDVAVTDSDTTKAFVDYLADVSPTGPFWIGLARNLWTWVEEYDQGKYAAKFNRVCSTRRVPTQQWM